MQQGARTVSEVLQSSRNPERAPPCYNHISGSSQPSAWPGTRCKTRRSWASTASRRSWTSASSCSSNTCATCPNPCGGGMPSRLLLLARLGEPPGVAHRVAVMEPQLGCLCPVYFAITVYLCLCHLSNMQVRGLSTSTGTDWKRLICASFTTVRSWTTGAKRDHRERRGC